MKKLKPLILVSIFLLIGCQHTPDKDAPEKSVDDTLRERVATESERLIEKSHARVASLEKKAPKTIELMPVKPDYDPLGDQIVSFSMADEDLSMVLYTIARSMGMNLIIDPSIDTNDKPITLNFEQVSASKVLNEVLGIYDLYYETDENIIRIKPMQEAMFKLNFLDTSVSSGFDVGGDVFGAGDSETATGLSGSFRLSGEGVKKGNPYDSLEDMIQRIKTGNGIYALNRLSGTLFIKDNPSVIKTASKIIHHFKTMLSKQILIETRIIEVALSDEFRYGIDWSVIQDKSQSKTVYTNVSWSVGNGLVISNNNANLAVNPMGEAIDALQTFGDTKVVSNPIIRSKHGKPSIISVGTSFSYKKSVETTTTGGDNPVTETDVEVSTVFDGLILGVIPFIEESGKISLLINPIKSDVDRPSLELINIGSGSGQSIALPQVNVKEISTTISLNDGDVIILGGLIDKNKVTQNSSVPILSSIPALGYLFKNDIETDETSEMVIILTVSVI